jgi:hypothetical protein
MRTPLCVPGHGCTANLGDGWCRQPAERWRCGIGWPVRLEPGLELVFRYPVTGADTAAAVVSGEAPVLATLECSLWPSR